MKFLIVAVFAVAACQALPQQRRLQHPQQQLKSIDQQSQPSDQDYRQPINVAEFSQPQAAYNKAQDYKVKDGEEKTTTWIPILKFNKQQETDGSYMTSYETGNNIIAEETGFLKNNAETDIPSLVQHGSYTYISPEGQTITVEYTADEFGFRATGDHIPTPPPVSAEIQKGLDLIYAGIKANAEKREQEQKAHPEEYAKRQADRAALDFAGQYYPQ